MILIDEKIQIRVTCDIHECLSIRNEVFVIEQKVPLNLEIDGLDETSTHFILSYKGTPCATARTRDDDNETKIERMCVLVDYRNKGLGEKLLSYILKYSQAHSKTNLISLSSQIQAVGFYKKLGFKQFGMSYMDAGIAHVNMRGSN